MNMLLAAGFFVIGIFCANLSVSEPMGKEISSSERIYFSVFDKLDKPVLGLSPDEFEFRINGKPAALNEFRCASSSNARSIPLIAWILIDFNPKIDAGMIRRQAGTVTGALELFNADSALGIKLVSDRSETLAPLGHDPGALARAFTDFSERRIELKAKPDPGTVGVQKGGMLQAMEYALGEMESFIAAQPSLQNREVYRAIMIISNGGIDPFYSKRSLYEQAIRSGAFFYPVLMPGVRFRSGARGLFELAKKTGGALSVLGSLTTAVDMQPLPRGNGRSNALAFNFMLMVRDLNAKYSFGYDSLQFPRGVKLELKSLNKTLQVRMPRKTIP
jgi:hypothetical protein